MSVFSADRAANRFIVSDTQLRGKCAHDQIRTVGSNIAAEQNNVSARFDPVLLQHEGRKSKNEVKILLSLITLAREIWNNILKTFYSSIL